MKIFNQKIFDHIAADSTPVSQPFCMDGINYISLHSIVSDGDPNGYQVGIEASNEEGFPTTWCNYTQQNGGFVTNSPYAAIFVGFNIDARWMRFTYTNNLAKEQLVTCVADISGSLNNTYFFFYDNGGAHSAYCLWFNVDGAGVDPAIPGYFSIEVPIAENDDVLTVAAALYDAIVLPGYFNAGVNGLGGVFMYVHANIPSVRNAQDGGVPTGFSFSVVSPTGYLDMYVHGWGRD